jgi:two-component system, LytTR family, sensor kinase
MSRARVILWILLSVGAAALLSSVEIVSDQLQSIADGRAHDTFSWAFRRILPVWVIFVALLWAIRWLVQVLPIRRRSLAPSIAVHAVAALAFPVIHIGALCLYRIANGEPMTASFAADNIAFYYVRGVALYAFAATAFHTARAWRETNERRVTQAELQASLAEARLQTLRGQLSPHFLFNVLNTIGMLVRADRSDDALDVLTEFSDLLRGFLRQSESELVSLDDEVRFAARYLGIQSVRFADRLRVAFEVGPELRDRAVPSFVLYPLVENAVKHGVAHMADGGRITVRARDEAETLVIEVEDDGPGFDADHGADGTGLGLANLRARLETIYGGTASLVVGRGALRGSIARVVLPA